MKCCKCGVNRQIALFKKNGKILKSCGFCRGDYVCKKEVHFDENENESADDESEEDESDTGDESEIESVDCEESESDENECEESESDDSEESDDSIYCDACDKKFYDKASAIKHANTITHKKKWQIDKNS